jgi:hypothetical protein
MDSPSAVKPTTVGIVGTPHGRAATAVGVVQGVIAGWLVTHYGKKLGIDEDTAFLLSGGVVAFSTRLFTALSVKLNLQI